MCFLYVVTDCTDKDDLRLFSVFSVHLKLVKKIKGTGFDCNISNDDSFYSTVQPKLLLGFLLCCTECSHSLQCLSTKSSESVSNSSLTRGQAVSEGLFVSNPLVRLQLSCLHAFQPKVL